ncbi:MAG TPA: DUF4870 domain-containing protein [Candidatus Thermoplasmatota archaeon]|nr:DUF4870 domain-containing protein [Candidatus Thermoplasmatota archaeon]
MSPASATPTGWAPAPPSGPAKPDTTYGTIAYVLPFVAGWIGPLVMFLVAKKEDKLNRFHCMQALLLSIAQFLVSLPLFAIWFVPLLGLPMYGGEPDPDRFLPTFFGLFIAFAAIACGLSILFMVLYIVGAVKASRAEMWRLPLLGNLADKWS